MKQKRDHNAERRARNVRAFVKGAQTDKGMLVKPDALRAGRRAGQNILFNEMGMRSVRGAVDPSISHALYRDTLRDAVRKGFGDWTGLTWPQAVPYRKGGLPVGGVDALADAVKANRAGRAGNPVYWDYGDDLTRRHELAHWLRMMKGDFDPSGYKPFRPWTGEEFRAGYLSVDDPSAIKRLHEGFRQRYNHPIRWSDDASNAVHRLGRRAANVPHKFLGDLTQDTRGIANAVGRAEMGARRAAGRGYRTVRGAASSDATKLQRAGQRIGRQHWDEVLRYADDAARAARRGGGKAIGAARTGGRALNKALPWVDAGFAAYGAGQGLARPELATRNIEQGGAIGNVARSVFDPVTMGRNAGALVGTAARGTVSPVRGAQTLRHLPREFYRYWSNPEHGGYAGQAGDWMGEKAYKTLSPRLAWQGAKRLATDPGSTRLGHMVKKFPPVDYSRKAVNWARRAMSDDEVPSGWDEFNAKDYGRYKYRQ